ncbi:MAG TPA: nitrate reductase [Planctomycetota bacterium]|nr:nitrate reductase [Planctomycetota bacterium]
MIRPRTPGPLVRASKVIRQWDGKLTRELLLSPGGFGLGRVPERLKPDATTTMVCGYCSTGCGLKIHLKDGHAVSLTPDTNYPVNLGMACPKGWEALTVLNSPDRATVPLLRKDGKLVPTDWPTAIGLFVERFKAVQARHGAESLAWIGTGQLPNEELAWLGALAKFGMGMVHGDGNTRQCMATAVTAYKESFGFDAPPYTYRDLEESDVIVLLGANVCIAHPILWERVLRNRHNPAIIAIDPRRTETAAAATLHLQIHPKSDLALLYGIARILIENGWIDREFIDAHTSGFDAFAAFVQPYTPDAVAKTAGLPVESLERFAELIHAGKRVSFWWTMGVNQSHEGVRTAQGIINLALMTGNIGRPGTGANSITGQCNAMGSRLFSNTTNLLGGHDFTNPAHREKIARLLKIDVTKIPDRNSWAYDQILDGVRDGKIRGLWIIGTNSAHSWINRPEFQKAIRNLEFLVVQDMYHTTETAQIADLVLPAAGWGEKEGTFINSERRIGLLKKVARAPGQALADFSIFRLIADAWGCGEVFREWESPEAVFQILKRVSEGQPCDISRITSYQTLDEHGGVQWPYPQGTEAPAQERRLFEDGQFFHADRRARFVFEAPRELPDAPDREFPMLLLTGRGSASQWHTQTRTSKSAVLRKLYPQNAYVEIHPADAQRIGVAAGEAVSIQSRRGQMEAAAFITQQVQPGQIFVPMHYAGTNLLTASVFDPYSRQPSYKATAVRISRAAAPKSRN